MENPTTDLPYGLYWIGKQAAYNESFTDSDVCIVPDESNCFIPQKKAHIFIEGENFQTLKALRQSYAGKFRLIYIDPPYNTGNDGFVYADKFQQTKKSYKDSLEHLAFTVNTKDSGHYHSAWLSMIYQRLLVAYELLADNGAIVISIDDHELYNLRLILDEIFGQENFVVNVIWKKRGSPPNDKTIASVHEYLLVFAKNIKYFEANLLPRDKANENRFKNPDNDPKGLWTSETFSVNAKGGRFTKSCYYEIENPNTKQKFKPPEGRCWRCNELTFKELLREGRVLFGKDGKGAPQYKKYASEIREGFTVPTIWDNVGFTSHGTKALKEVINSAPFDNPKPVELLERVIRVFSDEADYILDFFGGSGTTAHAVLQVNAQDHAQRKFVCIQVAEAISSATEIPFTNIAQIWRKRIFTLLETKFQEQYLLTFRSVAKQALEPNSPMLWAQSTLAGLGMLLSTPLENCALGCFSADYQTLWLTEATDNFTVLFDFIQQHKIVQLVVSKALIANDLMYMNLHLLASQRALSLQFV